MVVALHALASDYAVSVKQHGAVGNGTTDDTAAIQAALDAGMRAVYLPGATYKITAQLVVPAGVFIGGYGATLSCTGSQFNPLKFVNGGGVCGLTLVGPAAATYNSSGQAIRCAGTNNAPSAPTFVTAPIIRDCTIRNFGKYGVALAYTNGGLIDGCTIEGIGYAGVGGTSCNDLAVTNNTISSIGPGPGTGDAYGIFIDRENGTSETAEPRSYRCTVAHNKISDVIGTGGANGQGVDTHAGEDFTILGNRISGCQGGIYVTASLISSTAQLGPKRVTVTGNVVNGISSLATASNYGILVSGAIYASTVNDYAEGIVVHGNTIYNHGANNDSLSGGIVVQGTKGAVVSANSLRTPRSVGINVNLENLGISVTGNTITDPHDSTFSAPCCIRVTGNYNTGYIGQNTFVYEDSGVDTYVAVEAVRIATTLTGLDINLGRSSFVGASSGHLSYQELTATGVNSTGLYEDCGNAVVALVSADASNTLAVTFDKRFPAAPKSIVVSPTGSIVPGGKPPILTTVSVSAIGFTAVAYPADLTTWSASGDLNVQWSAQL